MWQGERKEVSAVQWISSRDHNQSVRDLSGTQEEVWSEKPDWELLTRKKWLICGREWFAQRYIKNRYMVTTGTLASTTFKDQGEGAG